MNSGTDTWAANEDMPEQTKSREDDVQTSGLRLPPVYGCGLNCMSHDGRKAQGLTTKFERVLTVADNTGFDFRMEFARGTLSFGNLKETTEA